jgi:hypothetical protein
MDLSCFKAYDLRGRVPDQLNPILAEKIGRAYVEITGAKKVIVGYDIRLSSPDIAEALSSGLMAAGADVFDIGLCGTEQVYFATSHYKMDGGIMVTASHNPKDHNGMKMVGPESRPISSDNGLNEIRDRVLEPFADAAEQGRYEPLEVMSAYVDHLLGYIDAGSLSPLTIVCNAGNGGAGLVIDELNSTCLLNSSKCTISQTAISRTAYLTRSSRKTGRPRPTPLSQKVPPWASPGTATTTAASSSTKTAALSRATTSSDCWPTSSCTKPAAAKSYTTPA